MMKTLSCVTISLMTASLATGCATASPDDYIAAECDELRDLVKAQDYASSTRGIEFESDRGLEELQHESGSPFAGRPRTSDERKLRDERQSIREAYRRKGCKA